MSKWVKQFIVGVGALLISMAAVAAEDTSNITITSSLFNDRWYKEVVWFDAYNVGGEAGTNTYVYNEAEGTLASSGEVSAKAYVNRTIQIRVATLGSTSIDVRPEGRVGTDTNWGEITTKNFTAATTIDYVIPINEFLEDIRVGVRSNGTVGTDSVTISGAMIGDKR